MEHWQELGYLFTLLSCITVLVSCSPYYNFAAFLCVSLHWNVDTVLDMTPRLPHNKCSSWRHTLCDVILLYRNFKQARCL